ncbi:keratin-associated protein 10-4-like [Paramacrobiotus metropolitanus]|uniref:keratin-associated protein 10-4-like n=1 Tax=Paramacrobiotus metropolitanus TaxID=2943436 RepID=UPI002445DE42|nr:keratin-associated protein 10-4-like [Paramacrobiotus metropolitanus]
MKVAAVFIAVLVAATSFSGCNGAANGQKIGGGVRDLDFNDVNCQNGMSSTMQMGCRTCEPTCSSPVSTCPVDVPNCDVKRSCVCKPGLVRTALGKCVPVSQCSAPAPATTAASTKRPTAAPPAPGPSNGGGLDLDFDDVNCQNGMSSTMQMGCPTCEPTCSSPVSTCPVTVPNCDVQRSCVCKPGLVRTALGKCVPVSQCSAPSPATTVPPPPPVTFPPDDPTPGPAPVMCMHNLHPTLQMGCPACEPTCSKPTPSCPLRGNDCPVIISCVCKDGLVRNAQGDCVNPSDCPAAPAPEAPPVITCSLTGLTSNPMQLGCPACEPTCSNFKPTCPLLWGPNCPVKSDCVCRAGTVRTAQNTCVKPSECPGVSILRNLSATCLLDGDAAVIEETSTDGKAILNLAFFGINCYTNMQKGCRNCEPTCSNRNPSCPLTWSRCPSSDVCVCKPGFMRNSQGSCVTATQCNIRDTSNPPVPLPVIPTPESPVNDTTPAPASSSSAICVHGLHPTLQLGCPACEPTCSKPTPSCPLRGNDCPVIVSCVCKEGLVRTTQGTCVPASQCPP